MQFHLNGFNLGDPSLSTPEGVGLEPQLESLPGEVDVLIVGCGPAGLTLAAQLAAFADIRTCIAEQKDGPLTLGQADGIACRTMEVFEAFGFADRVQKEAYWVNETTFWKPDEAQRGRIVRSGRIQDTEEGLSEFPHVILNQARVHDFLLETMRHSPSRLAPHYSRRLLDLRIDPAAADYPVTGVFERLDAQAPGETVRARYAVGCDGARSVVRQSLNRTSEGDFANQAWGVMDVLAVSDFPDMRLKALVQSANDGSLLIIPREGGYLVRLYIELDKLREDERIASRNITVDHLIAAAQRILSPYTLAVKDVAWWSVYEIGQRLCDRFDDVPAQDVATRFPRVFIAGDACHTHSPKAGQGMNTSLNDGFNLGWKLAAVLRRQSSPALLHTYTDERQAVARELIDFDRAFAEMFSAPPRDPDNPDSEGVDPAAFQAYFVKQGRFTAGTAIRYAPSVITGEARWQPLAQGFTIGMRLHSAPVIRLADARPIHLGHVVKADGRWRIIAFADPADGEAPGPKLRALCRFLTDDPASPVRRYTPAGGDIDAAIDVRAVFQAPHRTLSLGAMPSLMLPRKGRHGLVDYEKVFCADVREGADIFETRGIDRSGCIVIVRPDQYVSQVLPLDDHLGLGAFFDGFMWPQVQ